MRGLPDPAAIAPVLAGVGWRHGGGLLALSTAGDAAETLPFGLDINTLQTSVLVYLGLSSLVFVLVWVVGYLRSR